MDATWFIVICEEGLFELHVILEVVKGIQAGLVRIWFPHLDLINNNLELLLWSLHEVFSHHVAWTVVANVLRVIIFLKGHRFVCFGL